MDPAVLVRENGDEVTYCGDEATDGSRGCGVGGGEWGSADDGERVHAPPQLCCVSGASQLACVLRFVAR